MSVIRLAVNQTIKYVGIVKFLPDLYYVISVSNSSIRFKKNKMAFDFVLS